MKLYYSPTSPYVRKVVIMALETGLDAKIERIPAATTPIAQNPDVARANPIAKVPTLVAMKLYYTCDALMDVSDQLSRSYFSHVQVARAFGFGS